MTDSPSPPHLPVPFTETPSNQMLQWILDGVRFSTVCQCVKLVEHPGGSWLEREKFKTAFIIIVINTVCSRLLSSGARG